MAVWRRGFNLLSVKRLTDNERVRYFRAMNLWRRVGAFLWLITGCAWTVLAQGEEEKEGPILIEDIRFASVTLPREAAKGSAADRMLSESWWQVLVKFSNQRTPDPNNPKDRGFADEVTIRVFLDGEDDTADGTYVVFTSEITFLNVPPGREHFAAFYLYPTAANRYGGGRAARVFRESNVYAEAIFGGARVGKRMMKEENEANKEWYKRGRQLPNLLVPVHESPWWPFEAGTYNQIKR